MTHFAVGAADQLRKIATYPKVRAFLDSTAGKVSSYILNASYFKNNFELCTIFLFVKTFADYIRPPVVKNRHGRPVFDHGKVRRQKRNIKWTIISITTLATAYFSKAALKVAFVSLPIVLQHALRFSGTILQVVLLYKIVKTLFCSPKAPTIGRKKGPTADEIMEAQRRQRQLEQIQKEQAEKTRQRNRCRLETWTLDASSIDTLNVLYQECDGKKNARARMQFQRDHILPAEKKIHDQVQQHREDIEAIADETDTPIIQGMYKHFDEMPTDDQQQCQAAQQYYTRTIEPKEREIIAKNTERLRQREILDKADETDTQTITPLYAQYIALFATDHTQQEREQFYAGNLREKEESINQKHAAQQRGDVEEEEEESSSSEEDEPVPQPIPVHVPVHQARDEEYKGAPRDLLAPPNQGDVLETRSRSSSLNPQTNSAKVLRTVCNQIVQALGSVPSKQNIAKFLTDAAPQLTEFVARLRDIHAAPNQFCNPSDEHATFKTPEALQKVIADLIVSAEGFVGKAKKAASDMLLNLTPPESPSIEETAILEMGVDEAFQIAVELRATIQEETTGSYMTFAQNILTRTTE